jgi:enoyl-CoA hydratase/carnithine racemase
MVGADTAEFWPALDDPAAGAAIAATWSKTARRFAEDFEVSVAFIAGKRLLGGMLELLEHCHYVIAHDKASVGMPEVTVPVVPGMEGCHWPFRKAQAEDWPKLLSALLTGRNVRAKDAVGWWIDYAGPMDDALKMAWNVASGGDHGLTCRGVETGALSGVPTEVADLPDADSPAMDATRDAIVACVQASCGVPIAEALDIQAKHSCDFLSGPIARKGRVGMEFTKTNKI